MALAISADLAWFSFSSLIGHQKGNVDILTCQCCRCCILHSGPPRPLVSQPKSHASTTST